MKALLIGATAMFNLMSTSFKPKNTVRTTIASVDSGEFNLSYRLYA